jgi:hypothetical protein
MLKSVSIECDYLIDRILVVSSLWGKKFKVGVLQPR